MARKFHPDRNFGLDTIEMMNMINEARVGLEDQLRTNDASREEECVGAAENDISIPSDSESSNISSKPASSSSKESTLPVKQTNDNEETPLKKNHPQPWI